MLAFVMMIIGLANPQIGSKLEKVERKGIDLVIAIDVSESMLAQDIKPNRLQRARQAISRLVDELKMIVLGLWSSQERHIHNFQLLPTILP